ncbi:MAG: HAMP domain-containing histidine kinase [Colwellia sp.]|nr:HAMP domain-containing histidine kinase [Colwellia sp.]MCW8866615.1 HAMP domain-containing histidine kinase [Colwellia sp.]MCW9082462.1 HAMP domain-containing histidine kinase [Colwellia sp.]
MTLSLYQRLALVVCFAFTLLASLIFYWSNSLAEQSKFQAEQKLHIQLAEHLAHDNPLLQDGVYDKAALENLFHTLMLLGPAFEFYFLDPAGNIVTYSADPAKIKRKVVDLSPIVALIANPTAVPIFADDPRSLQGQKIFSAAPIYHGDNLQGYLYVIIGGEIYDSIFSQVKNDKYLQQYGTLVIGALVLLLIILLAVFRYFTAPIRRLSHEMQAIKAVNFDQTKVTLSPWQSSHNNEVHYLGNTFNTMVTQINQQFAQLTENDRIRRELLAHLSHDLRTPLATMQGYIETLTIKNAQLTQQERLDYLATAGRNAMQLKRLIDQIFELAHLEDGQVTVNLETFAIGELLHDIIAKFALKAKEKQIKLTLRPEQCRFIVYSDIAKLERIITNLLENALRHTDKKGEVLIEVSQLTDKIKISVTDNGTGISKEDIAYIFDARYRASNASDDSTPHAGLGLAISQKLSRILNSEIVVESQLGQGSCFSLSLQQVSH